LTLLAHTPLPPHFFFYTKCKAQGQTLTKVLSDTRYEAFAHGSAYVAASRTTSFSHLGYLHGPPLAGETGPAAFTNIVLQAALLGGQLRGAPRPPGQERAQGPMADDAEVHSDGENVKRTRKRARNSSPAPYRFQLATHALSIKQRKTQNHDAVQNRMGAH